MSNHKMLASPHERTIKNIVNLGLRNEHITPRKQRLTALIRIYAGGVDDSSEHKNLTIMKLTFYPFMLCSKTQFLVPYHLKQAK